MVVATKRKAWVCATLGGAAIVFVIYGLATLRLCDQAHNLTATDFVFRLCGMSSEFIATVPTPNAKAPPRYSWRNLDGNKPTIHRMHYATDLPTSDVTQRLVVFLRHAGFVLGEANNECQWWNRGTWLVCVETEPRPSGGGSDVVVTLDRGLD
jgi:hypothetical protein